MKNKFKKLSSRVSFFYKYVIPIIFISVFLILFSSLFYETINIDIGARVVLSFMSFIFCLTTIPLIQLKFIKYNRKTTVIKGLGYCYEVENKEVLKIRRFLIYFYQIAYRREGRKQTAMFMPHISGMFLSLFFKPKSIKEYESCIK